MAKYSISTYTWGGDYQPRAEAIVELVGEELHVKMTAWEETIVAAETKTGGMVCRDSCLEFFFMPSPERDTRYINIEVNPIGVMHIGIGPGRHGRVVLTELPEGVKIQTSITPGLKWSVRYSLPTAWIQSMFPSFNTEPGAKVLGNFYTCDERLHPHFGSAFPIGADKPDFHRPECFMEIEL